MRAGIWRRLISSDELISNNGINETTEYLELFLRNLILGEKNELRSRSLHINVGRDPINDSINDPIKLSDREETVYDLLAKDGSYTRAELADKTVFNSTVIFTPQKGKVDTTSTSLYDSYIKYCLAEGG